MTWHQWLVTAPRVLAPVLALCLPIAACHTGPVINTYDGVYTGEASDVSGGVNNCPATQTTNAMTVSGGEVSFGLFRGWVTPDGSVQMQSQQNTLSGHFENKHFIGTFQMGMYSAPGIYCTYQLNLAQL